MFRFGSAPISPIFLPGTCAGCFGIGPGLATYTSTIWPVRNALIVVGYPGNRDPPLSWLSCVGVSFLGLPAASNSGGG